MIGLWLQCGGCVVQQAFSNPALVLLALTALATVVGAMTKKKGGK